jgi:hypothetical protein
MGIIAASRLRASVRNPIFDNAAAYYKMEETTGNLIDSVNAHNGILFGDITRGITGIIDKGYEFEATNDSRIELPNSIYDNFTNNNYTFLVWFKSSSNSNDLEFIIDDLSLTNFDRRKLTVFISSGKVTFAFGDNYNNRALESSAFTINSWNLFLVKYDDNDKVEIKLNNVLQGSYTFVNAPSKQAIMTLGRRREDLAFPYTGELDEIAFINGQTTDTEDTNLWNNGNGITY